MKDQLLTDVGGVAALAPLQGLVVDDSACDMDDLAPCGGVEVTAPGDTPWAAFVARAVASQWPGLELLADRAETVAEAVRDNAGLHGVTVGDVVASVRAWDRRDGARRMFAWAECGFEDGTSVLAGLLPDGGARYEIQDVTFLFKQGTRTAPIRDPELAGLLGVERGDRLSLEEAVRRVAGS